MLDYFPQEDLTLAQQVSQSKLITYKSNQICFTNLIAFISLIEFCDLAERRLQ